MNQQQVAKNQSNTQSCEENQFKLQLHNILTNLKKQYRDKSLQIALEQFKDVFGSNYGHYIEALEAPIFKDATNPFQVCQTINSILNGENLLGQYIKHIANAEYDKQQKKKIINILYTKTVGGNAKNGFKDSKNAQSSQGCPKTIVQALVELMLQSNVHTLNRLESAAAIYENNTQELQSMMRYIRTFPGVQRYSALVYRIEQNIYLKNADFYEHLKRWMAVEAPETPKEAVLTALARSLTKEPIAGRRLSILQIFTHFYCLTANRAAAELQEAFGSENDQNSVKNHTKIDQSIQSLFEAVNDETRFREVVSMLQHGEVFYLKIEVDKSPKKVFTGEDWKLFFHKASHRLTQVEITYQGLQAQLLVIQDNTGNHQAFANPDPKSLEKFYVRDVVRDSSDAFEAYSGPMKVSEVSKGVPLIYNAFVQTWDPLSNIGSINLSFLAYNNLDSGFHTLSFAYPDSLVALSVTGVNLSNLGACKKLENLQTTRCKFERKEFVKLQKLVRLYSIDDQYVLEKGQTNESLLNDILNDQKRSQTIHILIIVGGKDTLCAVEAKNPLPRLMCLELQFDKNEIKNEVTIGFDLAPELFYTDIINGSLRIINGMKNTFQSLWDMSKAEKAGIEALSQFTPIEQVQAQLEVNFKLFGVENYPIGVKRLIINEIIKAQQWSKKEVLMRKWDEIHNCQTSNNSTPDFILKPKNIAYDQANFMRTIDLLCNLGEESTEGVREAFQGISDKDLKNSLKSALKVLQDQFGQETCHFSFDNKESEKITIYEITTALTTFQSFSNVGISFRPDPKKLAMAFNENLFARIEGRVQRIFMNFSAVVVRCATGDIKVLSWSKSDVLGRQGAHSSEHEGENVQNLPKNKAQRFFAELEAAMETTEYYDVVFVASNCYNDNDETKAIQSLTEHIADLKIRYLSYWHDSQQNYKLKLKFPEALRSAAFTGVTVENLAECKNLRNVALSVKNLINLEKLENIENLQIDVETKRTEIQFDRDVVIKQIQAMKNLKRLFVHGKVTKAPLSPAVFVGVKIGFSTEYFPECSGEQKVVQSLEVTEAQSSVQVTQTVKTSQNELISRRWARLLAEYFAGGLFDVAFWGQRDESGKNVAVAEMWKINLELIYRQLQEEGEFAQQIKEYLVASEVTQDAGAIPACFARLVPNPTDMLASKDQLAAFGAFRSAPALTEVFVAFDEAFRLEDVPDEEWARYLTGGSLNSATTFYAEKTVKNRVTVLNFALVCGFNTTGQRVSCDVCREALADDFFKAILEKNKGKELTYQAVIMTTRPLVTTFGKLPLTRLSYFLDALAPTDLVLEHPELLVSASLRNVRIAKLEAFTTMKTLATNFCIFPVTPSPVAFPVMKSLKSRYDVNFCGVLEALLRRQGPALRHVDVALPLEDEESLDVIAPLLDSQEFEYKSVVLGNVEAGDDLSEDND